MKKDVQAGSGKRAEAHRSYQFSALRGRAGFQGWCSADKERGAYVGSCYVQKHTGLINSVHLKRRAGFQGWGSVDKEWGA
eukprot:1160580-Pelagomonas_calceolata.AAC.12